MGSRRWDCSSWQPPSEQGQFGSQTARQAAGARALACVFREAEHPFGVAAQIGAEDIDRQTVSPQRCRQQRLVPAREGGMVPAYELLVPTPHVRELVEEGQTTELAKVVETSSEDGIVSFNRSLLRIRQSPVLFNRLLKCR